METKSRLFKFTTWTDRTTRKTLPAGYVIAPTHEDAVQHVLKRIKRMTNLDSWTPAHTGYAPDTDRNFYQVPVGHFLKDGSLRVWGKLFFWVDA